MPISLAWLCPMSMIKCKTAVSPLLMHWRYCSLALSHRHQSVPGSQFRTPYSVAQHTISSREESHPKLYHRVCLQLTAITLLFSCYIILTGTLSMAGDSPSAHVDEKRGPFQDPNVLSWRCKIGVLNFPNEITMKFRKCLSISVTELPAKLQCNMNGLILKSHHFVRSIDKLLYWIILKQVPGSSTFKLNIYIYITSIGIPIVERKQL